MKKRFLAALLSLCMTLTLLPTTAFAALSDSLGNIFACYMCAGYRFGAGDVSRPGG